MEITKSRFVNILRHVVLIYGGSVLWGFVWKSFDPAFYAGLVLPDESTSWKHIFVAGIFVPSFLTCCHDRGWRMKSPFYRISDETDLLKRVERLEQRSNCLQ